MKTTLLILSLLPLWVCAEPSSQIAWTPELLKFVKAGNADNGQSLAAACTGCHGEKGVSLIPETPSLAGQMATYIYKQLRDYADGSRSDAMMSAIAQGLDEQQCADLAVWFASLNSNTQGTTSEVGDTANRLVFKGDGKRTLAPCFVCHGKHGEGEKMDIPALAGQRQDYLIKSMQGFKTGVRKNDIYRRMRLIAAQLSDEEIKAIAEYYQTLK